MGLSGMSLAKRINKLAFQLIGLLVNRAADPPANPTRVLLIRRNHLGDAVCVVALAQGLKSQYPDLQIDVLANSYNSEIFRRCTSVSHVFELPETWLVKRYGAIFHPVIKKLRSAAPYDLVINASGSYSSKAACLALVCPGKFRLGIASETGAVWDHVWDQHITSSQLRSSHMVERLAELCGYAALPLPSLPAPRLRVSAPISVTEPINSQKILLCPVVKRPESRWPDHMWSTLAAYLVEEGNSITWLSQRPADRANDSITRPESIGSLIDTLSIYRAVICSEGGTSHLAPAVGVLTVVLSGKKIRESWRPWSDLAVLIERPDAVATISAAEVVAYLSHLMGSSALSIIDRKPVLR